MSLQAILTFYLFPLIGIFSAILILPFPRFVKRACHFFIDLKIQRISQYRIGSLLVLFLFIMAVSEFLPYFKLEAGEEEAHLNFQA